MNSKNKVKALAEKINQSEDATYSFLVKCWSFLPLAWRADLIEWRTS